MEKIGESTPTLLVEAPLSLNAIIYRYLQGGLALAQCQALWEREVAHYVKSHAFSGMSTLFTTLAMDESEQAQFQDWFATCEQTIAVSERLSLFAKQYELIFVIYTIIPATFTTDYPSQGITIIPSADYLAS